MTAQTLLRRATGLNLSKSAAERAVRRRMALGGSRDSAAYLAAMTPAELSELIELVVVPESWMFRDPQAFHAATEFVARRWQDGARPQRILSLPCAGGEEPYSMAMALCEAGLPAAAYSIDAVDLSPACVARARIGVYGRNAFRTSDLDFRARHFTALGDDQYRIDAALRASVNFRQGNLLDFDGARPPGGYDVIFCRNLLIYFDQATTAAAIAVLAGLLADDGMLLAGYAEVPSFCRHGFVALTHRQAFALQKKAAAPAPKAVRAAPQRQNLARSAPTPLQVASPRPAPAPAPTHAAAAPPENLLEQARLLADQGHFQDAAEKCRAHLLAAPEAADAYFILGILSEQVQKLALAEDYWRRCLYLEPEHYDALCHLALLDEHKGNGAGAAVLKARAARIFQRRQDS